MSSLVEQSTLLTEPNSPAPKFRKGQNTVEDPDCPSPLRSLLTWVPHMLWDGGSAELPDPGGGGHGACGPLEAQQELIILNS